MAGTALDMASSDEEELAPVANNAAAAMDMLDVDSDDDDDSGEEDGLLEEERAVLQGGRKRPRPKKVRKPKAKKPRKNRVDKYITMEAEEDDDDGAVRRRSRSDRQEAAAAEAAADKIRAEQLDRKRDALETKSAHDLAAYFSEREREMKYSERTAADDGAAGGLAAQQAELPSLRDPKLWMIKVKLGQEMEISIALTNKYVAKQAAGTPLSIFSVTSTTKEYIYVEAHRENDVREAIQGIPDVYGWKPGAITLMPIDQMTTAITMAKQSRTVVKGQWVRFSRGAYKGDIAQVRDVMEDGRVLVRAVPRLDIALIAMTETRRKAALAAGRSKRRPPCRLFDRGEMLEALQRGSEPGRDVQGLITRGKVKDKESWKFKGAHFVDGFLWKEVKPTYLEVDGEKPSQAELKFFQIEQQELQAARRERALATGVQETLSQDEIDFTASLAATLTATASRKGDAGADLAPGDRVVITQGELADLEGRVVSVHLGEDTFVMALDPRIAAEAGFTGHIEVRRSEAMKLFNIGDHVKVVGGIDVGTTGTVIHTAPDEVTGELTAAIRVDLAMDQKKVEFRNLRISTEIMADSVSLEGYSKFDLVELNNHAVGHRTRVGVVVGIANRNLVLMCNDGKVEEQGVKTVRGNLSMRSKRAVALDQARRQFHVGDMVKVLQGPHKGHTATVKHLHNRKAFLHSDKVPSHAGVFVVDAKQVVRSGQQESRGSSLLGSSGPSAGGVQSAGAMSRRSKDLVDEELRGKTVRITRGSNRGKLGMVKQSTGNQVKVELHATQKIVTKLRSEVEIVGDANGAFEAGRFGASGGMVGGLGGATPMGGATPFGATPMLGAGMTPAMGGATPMMGGMTPAMGGMTPGLGGGVTPADGGATPAYGGATPAYGGATPAYGGATPAYGGATPAYGGATPAYGASTPAGAGGAIPDSPPLGAAAASGAGVPEVPSVPSHCVVGAMVTLSSGARAGAIAVITRVEGSDVIVELQGADGTSVTLPAGDTAPIRPSAADQHVWLSAGGQEARATVFDIDEEEGNVSAVLDSGAIVEAALKDVVLMKQ